MERGSISLSKEQRPRKILEGAARERQEGIQGQWQQASPFREVLEQARGNVDTGCSAQIMRGSFIATRDDSWEEFRKGMQRKREKSSEWTLEKTREAYEKVAREDIGRLGTRKGTDFLRRIIAPVDGMGGVTLSYICPHCVSPWRTTSGGCRPDTESGRSHLVVHLPATVSPWRTSSGGSRPDTETATKKKRHCSWWCAVCGSKHE